MAFIKVTPEALEILGTAKGAYILVFRLAEADDITLKGKKPTRLAQGWYCYAGSANGAGGLPARLRRHFLRDKKIHWHIDRLTTQAAEISAFAVVNGNECDLVARLLATGGFTNIFPGFGSSDCRQCISHLLMPTDRGFEGVPETLSI